MASNYTTNYKLCQWQASDQVLRTEFNTDNAKIDAAIKTVDNRVTSVSNSKASVTDLNSLKSTVDSLSNSKADKSALESLKNTVNSLSSTVSSQGSTLALKGNCQVVVTSYTGDGQSTRTHTFSKKPVMFFITGSAQITVGYGCTFTYSHNSVPSGVGVEWSGNRCTLTSRATGTNNSAMVIANSSNITYQMIVLYDQST